MKKKDKPLEILVAGSGLSSLTFIEKYLEKKNKVDVISPNFDFSKIRLDKKNDHIFKILPPQMSGKEKSVRAYFQLNNIIIKKNCKLFGSLEFGGLSNYWGLQIDPNILQDLNNFKNKTKQKILISFEEIMKKFKLAGKFENKSNKIDFSLKKKNFFNKSIKYSFGLLVTNLILGFQNKKKKKDIEKINETNDMFIPKNFYKNYLKNKKITFHNYMIKKISKHKKVIEVTCSNGINEKKFLTKKLILGCGTIVTTKILMEYLNIKKEIRLKHHPRLFTLFFLKERWVNKMIFQPSQHHIKLKKNKDLFTTDFRPGNLLIINSIIKFKKYLYPFKFILNFLRFNMLFLNTFLHPKFSDIYLKLGKKNILNIYSKNKDNKNIFNKTSNLIYSFFRENGKILPFKINYFPGYGADFHYFGTLKIGGKGKMVINENCQLKDNKNIYIIDSSVFNFEKNKYPLGLVLANSRRVAKDI